jgi:hypothetical protein
MFFNPRKRAAARELEVALYYLLHDARAFVPLLKETYKDKWSVSTRCLHALWVP